MSSKNRFKKFLKRLSPNTPEHHSCEYCPLSWEERGCEGDCDCGCYIYKEDLYDGQKLFCKLPLFVKYKISRHIKKKIEKQQAHQYDGITEWYEKRQKMEQAMRTAIKEALLYDHYDGELFICNESNGKLYKLDTESILREAPLRLIDRYEELLSQNNKNTNNKGEKQK